MKFYILRKYFKHLTNPGWCSNYLEDYPSRLTNILGGDFPISFWENYVSLLKEAEIKNHLLVRAKYVTLSDEICLFQVWKSREIFLNILSKMGNEAEFENVLSKHNLSWRSESKEVGLGEALSAVEHIGTRPHLFQILQEPFMLNGVKVGDPLKEGDLCYPGGKLK